MATGPKKVDDGIEDEAEAVRHERSYGRIPRSQGLRNSAANAIRTEDMDERYGRMPGKQRYMDGGEVGMARRMSGEDRLPQGERPRSSAPRFVEREKPRVRVPAGSSPANPTERPRVRVRAGSSPVAEAPRPQPVTQAGGASPPASPPPSRAMAATPEPRPPMQAGSESRAVARPSPAPSVPQRGATVVPEGPRFVPSTVVPPAQIAGPPAQAAATAQGVARRAIPRLLGPAGVALTAADLLRSSTPADGTLPEGQRYGGQGPDRPPGPSGMRSERAEEATNPDAPASPDGVTYSPARGDDALPLPPEFVEPPPAPRRRRMSGSVRPGRMSEADELNEMSLRAARGEPAEGRDPREATVRRAMGMKKGGMVGKKECYASGGAVGKSRDGVAVRGKTKGRFC